MTILDEIKILQSIGVIIGCLLIWALGGIMQVVASQQIEGAYEILFYIIGAFFLAVFAIFAYLAISDIYE